MTSYSTADLQEIAAESQALTKEEVQQLINGYTSSGFAATQEWESTEKLLILWDTEVAKIDVPARKFAEAVENLLVNENITFYNSPATYTVAKILVDMFALPESDYIQKTFTTKVNDGMWCLMSGSGCGPDPIRSGVAIVSGGAANYGFKKVVSLQDADLESAIATVISAIVILLINSSGNCNRVCDDCFSAIGIGTEGTTCRIPAIEALGEFDHNEGFDWRFSPNRNGVYTAPQRTLTKRFPRSGFPSQTKPFDVIVDVICDGNTVFNWSLRNPVTIDPRTFVTDFPTATFSPTQLIDGYFLRPNTRLCFSIRTLDPEKYTFVGWEAYGGSPSTGSAGLSFCTQFPDVLQPRGVNVRFRDNCTGNTYLIQASSFLICSTCG